MACPTSTSASTSPSLQNQTPYPSYQNALIRGNTHFTPLVEINPNTLGGSIKNPTHHDPRHEWGDNSGFSPEFLAEYKKELMRKEAAFFPQGWETESFLSHIPRELLPTSFHHVSPQSTPSYNSNASCPEEALPKDLGAPAGPQAGGENLQSSPEVEQGNHAGNKQGTPSLFIPSALVKNIEIDYEKRAVVGMLFGPRPPVETLKAWIRTNWESSGIEVSNTQALRNNTYIFLMKTPEMALQALAAGQWMLRNSPLCLFKWHPGFKPGGGNKVKSPIWVEFPDLPFQYYPILKTLAEPLGRVLGVRPTSDFNPRWHPQVLVELDLSMDLPKAWNLVRDDGIEFHQEIFYKNLPNACFHCGVQGHIIKDCPRRSKLEKGSKHKQQDSDKGKKTQEQAQVEQEPDKGKQVQEQAPTEQTTNKAEQGKDQGKSHTNQASTSKKKQQINLPKNNPGKINPPKKNTYPNNNQFCLLEKLEDPVLGIELPNTAMTVFKQPPIDQERLEREVENLDSQVDSTPEPEKHSLPLENEGPSDMDHQKDNKRPQQAPLVTPEKVKDKKKKHFR